MCKGVLGVGPAGATALLNHFGTVGALVQADVAQLRKVPGVDAKTAEQVPTVLEADYRAAPIA